MLHEPYDAEKAGIVIREMADSLSMDLVRKGLVTDQIVITIGYDIENIKDPERRRRYHGSIVRDGYGRLIPKHSHGSVRLGRHTSSSRMMINEAHKLFMKIVNQDLLIRRMNITAEHVIPEAMAKAPYEAYEQMDIFTDYEAIERDRKRKEDELERERRLQRAVIDIKERYGKNAVLKGLNLEDGATARDRNAQIGGHKA